MTRNALGWFSFLVFSVGCSSGLEKRLQSLAPGDLSKVEAKVSEVLDEKGFASVVVHLSQKADLAAIYAKEWNARGKLVVNALQATAGQSQPAVLSLLQANERLGKVSDVEPLWICNCIVAAADEDTLSALASRADVKSIVANQPMKVDLEPAYPAPAGPETAVEWNISLIGADSVWADFGITGQGITVGNMDTGVQWDHPALKNKYRGWDGNTASHDYNWFDATSAHSRVPVDRGGHGTHTTGTIVGDDGGANQTGVAPGANWIMAAIIDNGDAWVAAAHRGFQWMIAPTDLDGKNPEPDLRPAVVNNSWGCNRFVAGCSSEEEFRDDVDAWIAAGIFPEFSAGNEGPGAQSMRWPGGYAESFSTGATNRQDTIAAFSSRGPGQDGTTKPEVVAPGDQVRSSFPGSTYFVMSGTSMAGPHVVGLVALLLQANSDLTDDDLANIIEGTAVQKGDPIPNNTYGWGRIDAYSAVSYALSQK